MNDSTKLMLNILCLIALAVSVTVTCFYIQAINKNTDALNAAAKSVEAARAGCDE